MRFMVLHGPNLNLLGTREPSIYGSASLEEVNDAIHAAAKELDVEVEIHQTNREGEFIDLLHSGMSHVDGALANPGAYAHTSRAIADAIGAVPFPVVEVHLSNIHAREEWRHVSYTAERAAGIVAGFGPLSYVVALHALKLIVEE
jgi:3-dehydroquinate dehydratase II